VLLWWYGLMALGGLAFGALGNRRPLGSGILLHPLMLYIVLVCVCLIALRLLMSRPLPEVIPDRALVVGCVIGLVLFLTGNVIVVHVLAQ
jgi:hypothetical protein